MVVDVALPGVWYYSPLTSRIERAEEEVGREEPLRGRTTKMGLMATRIASVVSVAAGWALVSMSRVKMGTLKRDVVTTAPVILAGLT
jgi:hypothetical protein